MPNDFDETEEMIEASALDLRRLLLNMDEDMVVRVKNEANGLIYYNSVRNIENRKANWLDLLVTDVFINQNKIQININNY